MEEEKENSALKRQREPVSEDNVPSTLEGNDEKKRRRLEVAGWSPKPSSSGLQAEFYSKPDTPMVPSVRSRIQQLSRRREGASPLAQRCLSDPGGYSPSVSPYGRVFREATIGQAEFHQRLERFKGPDFQASPTQTTGQASTPQMTRSNFVSAIQQKLHSTPAPSSKQASRIHQEREEELNQLPFQPISENAWLKRSISDPASSRRDCDVGIKDGSFSEAIAACEEKLSSSGPGEKAPSDCEAHIELDCSNKEQNEVREEKGNEDEQPGTQQPPTVLKLCFNEDQSFSKAPFSEEQSVSQLSTFDEQSLLEAARAEQSDTTERVEISLATEHGECELFSHEGGNGSSYSEEGIELSTDAELRLWQYPRDEDASVAAGEQEEDVFVKEEERELESSGVEPGCVAKHIPNGECYSGGAPVEMAEAFEVQEDESCRPEESQSTLDKPSGDKESLGGLREEAGTEDVYVCSMKPNQKDAGRCIERDDVYKQSHEMQTVCIEGDNMAVKSDRSSSKKETADSPPAALTETRTGCTELKIDIKQGAEVQVQSSNTDGKDGSQSLTHVPGSDHLLKSEQMEQDAVGGRQGVDGLGTRKAEEGGRSKKVAFILKPELINDSTPSENNTSTGSSVDSSMSGENDGELNSSDETNTSKIIDQMFEEVLECAESVGEEERRGDEYSGDPDSGIGVSPGNKDETEEASQKSGEEEEEEEEESKEEQCDESNRPECSSDELTFPPSGILSPLSRAVEAVVTPLRRAASREANPSSLLSTPEESHHPSPVEAAPLYSIEAYRTQRQNKLPTAQSVASGVQRQAPEKSQPQTSANTKEKIMALREEAGKLQTMIKQTLQALSCCTDEEHGRGSLEEAEAEKLLLVSSEKHSALQAEVARLRESGGDDEDGSQQPCRGTVRITNIQLPLKVEFVCSSHKRAGRPSHYFFVLIRYGPCNIIATPLATAADAQNGDTISFQTSITLKDIRSTFAIDVEVYSLSHISGSKFSVDQTSTKSRVTPRKLLNTITRSSNSVTSAALPALNTARSSSFVLVGSHQITLASLGHSKFPLDKMKLDGKIRRLLGDEFQEKVPFLSPLEGNIYLRLDSESHSDVQHQGFLTMFELIGGFGVWHRQYFVLVGCTMFHWNHPNDRETKEAEGSISLSSSHSRCVRTVKRDSCARPFTFELVSNVPEQQDASAKLWFSADSKQESLDWMEKLNQSLLDFNTWKQTSAAQVEAGQSDSCSSGKLRESIL
ncbi:anillin, actin binding protein 2 isoform X2 [Pungitius pungitius]|uniref:anillin, actin binding protein 2 isoform X2 n=1 Tax=Pungitius pungitius TaxID=134920 RepID=UPI002E14DE53